jgi:hypothetical protein
MVETELARRIATSTPAAAPAATTSDGTPLKRVQRDVTSDAVHERVLAQEGHAAVRRPLAPHIEREPAQRTNSNSNP